MKELVGIVIGSTGAVGLIGSFTLLLEGRILIGRIASVLSLALLALMLVLDAPAVSPGKK